MASRTEKRVSAAEAESDTFDPQQLLAANTEQWGAERAAAEAAYTARETREASQGNAQSLREALARADERYTAQRIAILAQNAYRSCLAAMGAEP